jgi:hypothetical protein
MSSWQKALLAGAAFLTATASAYAHMGGAGGHSSGGFHGFRSFHSRAFPFHRRGFVIGFPNTRFGFFRTLGWGGGPYSVGVVGSEYDGDDDFAPEDLHFRVQDSFGPGDIGRPVPPPETYDNGLWGAARMDPWRGYEPDGG